MSATNTIKGVVDSTCVKTKNTRKGDFDINYVTVDGVEFETGFKAVFSKGEMIKAPVEYKFGAWQYDANGSQDLPPVTAASTPAPVASSGSGKGAGGFPVDAKSGQISIIRQNSLNRAVEILAQWKYAESHGEAEYLKKLLEVALIVTDFNSGQHIMQLQAAQAANLEVVNV